MKIITVLFFCGVIVFPNVNCKKETNCQNCRDVTSNINQPPIARVGPDQNISLPLDSVLLDGSASNDPDGTINNWRWEKISGPSSFTIIKPSSAATLIKNLIAGTYSFELKVTDNGGKFATDTIQITVKPSSQPPPGSINTAPIVNAGNDIEIMLPGDFVYLNGTYTDAEGGITQVIWKKIKGPESYNIINSNSLRADVYNLVQGEYEFELTVTDMYGLYGKDTIKVSLHDVNIIPQNAKEKILIDQQWQFDWYTNIIIYNFYDLIPSGSLYRIFIKRDSSSTWVNVPAESINNPNSPMEYFIQNLPVATYGYGSLVIYLYGSDPSDTPDVKIVYW